MNIVITTLSSKPIYEQIREQIKTEVLKGNIEAGTCLPSIRLLASDLKVGIITVKRAYQELEQDGIVVNVQGKGCYVRTLDQEEVHRQHCLLLKERLADLREFCEEYAIDKDEALDMFEEEWRNKT